MGKSNVLNVLEQESLKIKNESFNEGINKSIEILDKWEKSNKIWSKSPPSLMREIARELKKLIKVNKNGN